MGKVHLPRRIGEGDRIGEGCHSPCLYAIPNCSTKVGVMESEGFGDCPYNIAGMFGNKKELLFAEVNNMFHCDWKLDT